MTKKRDLIPDSDVVEALRHIKEFNLSSDQIAYRYSVKNIDAMCYEMGIEFNDSHNEATKVFRLAHAVGRCKIIKDFDDREKLKEVDPLVRNAEQIRASGCGC